MPPPKPWWFEHVEFDDENEGHIARHRVRVDEVLSLLESNPTWRPNKKAGTAEWQVIGRTSAGRALMLVLTWDEVRMSVRPVTARDCTASEVERWI